MTSKVDNIENNFIVESDDRNLSDTEIDTIDTNVDTKTDTVVRSVSTGYTIEQISMVLNQPIPPLPEDKKELLGYKEIEGKFNILVGLFNRKREKLLTTHEWLAKLTETRYGRNHRYANSLFWCLKSWRKDFGLIHRLVNALDKIPEKDLIEVATKTTGQRAGQLAFSRGVMKALMEKVGQVEDAQPEDAQPNVKPILIRSQKNQHLKMGIHKKRQLEDQDDINSGHRRKILRLEQNAKDIEEYISLQQYEEDEGGRLLTKSKRNHEGISTAVKNGSKCYPWTCSDKDYTHIINVSDILQQEVLDFVNYISPTLPEKRMRNYVVNSIRKIVKKEWPTAKVLPFGSYYYNLYLPTSDIDIVVLGVPSEPNTRKVLSKLARALKDNGVANPTNCIIIHKSKVPIIKMTEKLTSYKVDISFDSTNGLKGAKYTENLLEREKALRPLTLILKQYLSLKSQNEVYSGGIGSFSLMCMVFSFLQMHPKIQSGEILAEQNMGTLLVEFLEFYGKSFNAEKVGIRVTDGGSYYSKIHLNRLNLNQTHLISIEDPQDPTNDLGAKSFRYDRVRVSFAMAFELLQARLLAYNNSRYEMHCNLNLTASQMLQHGNTLTNGLLTSILEVPQSTIEHRESITRIFYGGNFGKVKEEPDDEWEEAFEHFTASGSDIEEDIILPQLLDTEKSMEEKKAIYSKEEKEEIRQRNRLRRTFWEKKGGEELE